MAAAVAVTVVGISFTVTDAVAAVMLPQPLDTVRVYMPAEAVDAVKAAALRSVDEYPPGPLHEYDVAPVAVPVSVRVLPTHRLVADGVADTAEGTVFTVSAVVVIVVLPQALVAVSVYTPVATVPAVKLAGLRSVDE